MTQSLKYKYLWPKAGSHYRQLFVEGRIRAEVLYRQTIGEEPLTPEEVAADYHLPLDAVLEAIEYCRSHEQLLDAERAEEEASIQARGLDRWPHAPRDAE